MKTIIWIVGIFVVAIGIVVALSRGGGSAGFNPPLEAGKVNPVDYVKGNASSTVVLVEYSDFQCPACRAYLPLIRQVTQEYGQRIAFVYRSFPLTSIHFNSEVAARAAEAARKQGKFWEMHDLLFEKQLEWEKASDIMPLFENYASLIGINIDQFRADINSKEVKDFVRGEMAHGRSIGINSTPTFYLNGKKIENPRSIEEFRSLINPLFK
jgi:protein-disulfide isomerase